MQTLSPYAPRHEPSGGALTTHWRRLAPWAALAVIALTVLWFWGVCAHRIEDAPTGSIAAVFVTGCGDFEHFYHGALAMREGRHLYVAGLGGYIYPPLLALLYVPLTFLAVKTAALVDLVINLALCLACVWLAAQEVARRFSIGLARERVVVIAALILLLIAPKMRLELQMWQTNALMMLLVLLGLRALDRRPRLAGALLGAAVNIKYLPLIYLPYLLLRRRFTAAMGFVAGIIAFALLPALQSGWTVNAQHWGSALSGLARLAGIHLPAVVVANIDPITADYSISITSAMSRLGRAVAAPAIGWLLSGAVALVLAGVVGRLYRAHGVPLWRWPQESAQKTQPYAALLGLEWSALMAVALAFSPQTNPRHTALLLLAFAPLAAMLYARRSRDTSRAAWAATAILFLGLTLPPGTEQFAAEVQAWRRIGGAGWCMALMLPFYFIAGFRHMGFRAAAKRAQQWPVSAQPVPSR